MGGSASKSLARAVSYQKEAEKGQEISDILLTLMLENANFTDVLNLANPSACASYVFATAEALPGLLDKLAVEPKKGKEGEVYFAPISRLIPGLKKEASSRDDIIERNKMCIDVAYYYVRAFQIYGAVALTLLDANPTRRAVRAIRPMTPKRPQLATQLGGAITKRGSPEFYNAMLGTPFEPLLDLLKPTTVQSRPALLLETPGKENYNILILYAPPASKTDVVNLPAIVEVKGKAFQLKFGLFFDADGKVHLVLSTEGGGEKEVGVWQKLPSGAWAHVYEQAGNLPDSHDPFYRDLQDILRTLLPQEVLPFGKFAGNVGAGAAPPAFVPGVPQYQAVMQAGQAAIALPGASFSGRSSFSGFEQLKKLFDDRKASKPFPKAFCVARAMTLLNPIFSDELSPGKFYETQICRTRLDFEQIPDIMPRPGKTASANIYLKSLVSLYYDDYQVRGTEPPIFTQTETGRSDLRDASKKFANLYNITTNPEEFLESQTQFRQYPMCTREMVLEFKDTTFVEKLKAEVIKPMLDFQLQHTKATNEFLSRMFKVTFDKNKKPTGIRLVDEIKKGGREVLNNFGREANRLLLNYYLKSEAYFMKGILLIENNKDALRHSISNVPQSLR